MRVDKRITEMLSSCPDLVNLRPGKHYTENCIRCLSGCYAAKDTWAFSVLVFLLNFFPTSPLFSFPISLSPSFLPYFDFYFLLRFLSLSLSFPLSLSFSFSLFFLSLAEIKRRWMLHPFLIKTLEV